MNYDQLLDFARRYTAAWCSQNARSVAAFFEEQGSLSINDNAPAISRNAITQAAESFMTAFPDVRVAIDQLLVQHDRTEYHWTLSGANTGPGGAGKRVRISGYELWTFGADGLIANSQGHFDSAEYQRQLSTGMPER